MLEPRSDMIRVASNVFFNARLQPESVECSVAREYHV
jgi:hypothetical protein